MSRKAVGYRSICNWYGIEITEIENDYLKWRYSDEEKESESEIEYDKDGDAYFLDNNNEREYLNNYMKY